MTTKEKNPRVLGLMRAREKFEIENEKEMQRNKSSPHAQKEQSNVSPRRSHMPLHCMPCIIHHVSR